MLIDFSVHSLSISGRRRCLFLENSGVPSGCRRLRRAKLRLQQAALSLGIHRLRAEQAHFLNIFVG
jgi:hypothetical protein